MRNIAGVFIVFNVIVSGECIKIKLLNAVIYPGISGNGFSIKRAKNWSDAAVPDAAGSGHTKIVHFLWFK